LPLEFGSHEWDLEWFSSFVPFLLLVTNLKDDLNLSLKIALSGQKVFQKVRKRLTCFSSRLLVSGDDLKDGRATSGSWLESIEPKEYRVCGRILRDFRACNFSCATKVGWTTKINDILIFLQLFGSKQFSKASECIATERWTSACDRRILLSNVFHNDHSLSTFHLIIHHDRHSDSYSLITTFRHWTNGVCWIINFCIPLFCEILSVFHCDL